MAISCTLQPLPTTQCRALPRLHVMSRQELPRSQHGVYELSGFLAILFRSIAIIDSDTAEKNNRR
jgi:hypothetical protein